LSVCKNISEERLPVTTATLNTVLHLDWEEDVRDRFSMCECFQEVASSYQFLDKREKGVLLILGLTYQL
jgi:hypothetical protein